MLWIAAGLTVPPMVFSFASGANLLVLIPTLVTAAVLASRYNGTERTTGGRILQLTGLLLFTAFCAAAGFSVGLYFIPGLLVFASGIFATIDFAAKAAPHSGQPTDRDPPRA